MKVSLRQRRRTKQPVPFVQAQGSEWLWRSFDDLHCDLHDWSGRLPAISAVSGVPRSGVVVASMLATTLNVPLIALETLQDATDGWRPACSKKLLPKDGPILIVDDTLWSGGTLQEVRDRLPAEILSRCLFGAVYVNQANADRVDVCGFTLHSIQHCFAWNVLRDIHARWVLTDLDGVLCEDWPGDADDGSDNYRRWVCSAARRIRPLSKLRGIITGRVETFRRETEVWLASNGVQSDRLDILFPDVTSRRGQDVGARKAEVYAADPAAKLFIESDARQAARIFELTHRPVLCTDTLEMLQ